MNEIYGNSFILKGMYFFGDIWVKKISILAIPPLRLTANTTPQTQQFNRDILILSTLALSIGCFVILYLWNPERSNSVSQSMAALAFYRAFDVFIVIAKTGIFFIFRGDVKLNKAPLWQVRRVLVGILFNYVELIIWFSIIYLQIGLSSSCQFSEPVLSISQAFNLSYSTMTTIGYGKYTPNAMFSELMSFFQVITAMFILTLVVGSLLALLTQNDGVSADDDKHRDDNKQIAIINYALKGDQENASWVLPLCAFSICLIAAYLFFGETYCDVVAPIDFEPPFNVPVGPRIMPG